ncbi:ankycorbin [Narcine bancroftii]|uniref:ankycorbin n=1 Tax=Narcine bancroftii TaxID=1343680 RepID=UPI003831F3EE
MKSFKAKFKKSESQDWSKYDEKLLQAVAICDAEKVASLLNKRTLHATKLDTEGQSAYHLAAIKGHVDCLEVFLEHGVDVTALDGSGLNALHLAAKHGHPQCVKRLLQEKCPVNAVDSTGRIALHHAAQSGNFSCVQTLCDFKGPINIHDDDGCTPLVLAAQMSNYEMCRCLIVRGGDVNSRDKQGRTALMLACENNSVETVDVLVRSGANIGLVDALGHDAIHYSMVTGNPEILQLLHTAVHRNYWNNAEPELRKRQYQVLAKEKATSPRKRQAPLPPSSPSTQSPSESCEFLSTGESTSPSYSSTETLTPKNDQRLSDEVFELQQERQHLLQTISNLEQLVDKCQREKVLIAKDSGVQKLENQVQELTNKLNKKEQELQEVTKQNEILQGKLSLHEQGKCHENNENESMDEEEMLSSFAGTENLFSERSLNYFNEECLGTLQRQVESLTTENQELQGRLQELEYFQKEATESDSSESFDFIPVVLYDSLQAEFKKLKEQYEEMQAKTLEEGSAATLGKLVPVEVYEQLKVEHEQEVQRLQEALDELKTKIDLSKDVNSELKDMAESESQDVHVLRKELKEAQVKYEGAMSEIHQLEEQMQLGILSVVQNDAAVNTERVKSSADLELENIKIKLLATLVDKEQEEKKVKELEEKLCEMETTLTDSVPLKEYNEMRISLNSSLEETSRENSLLTKKYNKVEDELKELRRSLFGETIESGAKSSREVKEHFVELTEAHKELQEKCRKLQMEYQKKVEELGSVHLTHLPKEEHEEVKETLSRSLREAKQQFSDLEMKHREIQHEITRLKNEIDHQRKNSVLKSEHEKMKESLEKSLEDANGQIKSLKYQLALKENEMSQQKEELALTKGQTIDKEEHENITSSLKAEVNSLIIKLNDLTKKHEKTCTEVFQVQRQALFMKSEKYAAEEQVAVVRKQLDDLKSESNKINELHKLMEDSNGIIKEKDKKISELSKEVTKLKEALNSLSERTSAAVIPAKPVYQHDQQHAESLERQIKLLQQQLAQAESEHRAVVTIYRSHLLYAVQGRMDEDVQSMLLQILKMHKPHEQVM